MKHKHTWETKVVLPFRDKYGPGTKYIRDCTKCTAKVYGTMYATFMRDKK